MTESNVRRILRTIAGELSEVESNIRAIDQAHAITGLFGELLTQYGETLGIPRQRFSDSRYQRVIKDYLQGRFSTGTVDEIKSYIADYLNISLDNININEDTPGHFEVLIPVSYIDETLEDFINAIKPIGVSFTITWVSAIWDDSFWDEALWG